MHDDGSGNVYAGNAVDFSLRIDDAVLDRRLEHAIAKKQHFSCRGIYLWVSCEMMLQLSAVVVSADRFQFGNLNLVRFASFPESEQPTVVADECRVRRIFYHRKSFECVSHHSKW